VVLKRAGVDGNLNDPTAGVGVFKIKPISSENTYIFAHYELVVVDAHTLRVLGHKTGITSPHWPQAIPTRAVDNGVWPDGDVDQLAPGEDVVVQQKLHDLLADSIGETLLGFGLTGMRRDMEYGVQPAGASVSVVSEGPVTAQ